MTTTRFLAGISSPGIKFWIVNFAGFLVVLTAVLSLSDAIDAGQAAVEERRDKLLHYQSIARQAEAIGAVAKSTGGAAAADFIPGDGDGLVAANLQARLKDVADETKVSVISIGALPSKDVDGLVLFGAHLEVSGKLEALHTLARRIESETPILLITAVDMRNLPLTSSSATDDRSIIEMRIDVFGATAPRANHTKAE